MPPFELAQLNVARLVAPLDSPVLADFVANLERINTLAERSPGFVWRLQTEVGDATGIRHFGDDILVNLSVWRDVAALRDFVYRTAHVEIMRRRTEWFERMDAACMVLWWVASGRRPTLEEADVRLHRLREAGPTAEAFLFRRPFAPPGDPRPAIEALSSECPVD